MKTVAKYNLFKSISTLACVGTPIITLLCSSDMFVHRSETAISATGLFAILLSLLFFKDKIAENFKVPSTFVVSAIAFILILLVENILEPVKLICITTMIASGVDELTFKRFYKAIEASLPENAENYKQFGFIMTTTEKLLGETKNDGKSES